MELLVGPLQEAALAQQSPFGFGQEGHVGGGQVACGRDVDDGIGKRATNGILRTARNSDQPRPGYRCEWDGDLDLWIVISAGALKGFGPTMVEDVFAARMAFHVARRRAQESACCAFRQHMAWLPASSSPDRPRLLKRGQKLMCDEWIVGVSPR